MGLLFDTTLPVFGIVALGFWLAGRPGIDGRTIGNVTILVASPALMFSVLAGSEVSPAYFGTLAGGALWIAGGTAILAVGYAQMLGGGRRGLILPAVFWNAGNLTLPLARLAFGSEGLEAAAVVFVTMAILNSTAGIWIAKGDNGLAEVVRMPLVYGSVGGLAMAISGATLPRLVMEPIEMLAAMAIPLMLLNLGTQLRALAIADVSHSIAVVAIRMGGGLAFALLFVALFGVEGVARQVLILGSIMPSAVINAVFAQRYDADPALVASAVVLGTLVSIATIPVVLYALT